MEHFMMNGYFWNIKRVDPSSPFLVDRTGNQRVATTDPRTRCVYLSDELEGDFLDTVLLHELGHCVMFSYNLISEIHSFVDEENWIEAEEWICNFIADYGRKIFATAKDVLGEEAWMFIPYELERFIA